MKTFKTTTLLRFLSGSLVLILTACSTGCSAKGDNVPQTESPPKPQFAELYPVTINGKYAFIDQTGNIKFTLPDDVYTVLRFSEGLVVVARRVPNTHGRWGFADENGNFVIEAKFNLAKSFSEGLAAILVRENESSWPKIGYIDRSGRIVIQPQFEQPGTYNDFAFSEGLAPVAVRSGKWGFIDKTGKFVIEPQFSYAFSFSEGRAMVSLPGPTHGQEKWGFIDKQGQWILPAQYESVGQFSDGLAPVLVNGKVGFVDAQGQIVIKPQFESDRGCPDGPGRTGYNRFSEGLAAVAVNGKWGFIDRAGKWVIKPQYGCAEPFSQGLAVIGVRDERSWWRFGYIDKTGAMVIQPQFTYAGPFLGRLASASVDPTLNELTLKVLLQKKPGRSEAELGEEVAKTIEESQDPTYGYIDKTGKFVWKPSN